MPDETYVVRGSSNIASIGYDTDTETLTVDFHDGNSYDYFKVPQSVYAAFKVASSAGSFFARQVKGRYAYEQGRYAYEQG